MENLRMENHNGWLLSDSFLHLTSSPVCAHLPPLSSPADQAGSFPLSVLSSPRSSPLSFKLESQESPPLEFVSLSRSRDEPARNIQEAMAAVKDRMHTLSLSGSTKGGISCEGRSAIVVKEAEAGEFTIASLEDGSKSKDRMHTLSLSGSYRGDVSCEGRSGEVTIASLEDGSIGLKLGKRVFYEDAGGDEAAKQAENSSRSSKSGSSSSDNNINRNNGVPRKKHKGWSPSNVAPRCQVEGCHGDLSGSKDYHRRHKVCELHSKASVSKVAGLEQRFCQQCSRFHVLSEFDESRRSCRRRLAGHNERRRKQHPEPIPLLSAGTLAYLADSRFNTFVMKNPYLQRVESAMGSSSAVNTPKFFLSGLSPEEDVDSSYYQVLESDHIMQGLPQGRSLLDARRALIAASGNRLLLSTSSGPPSVISPASSSMNLTLNSQPSSETAFSGCALSLLSSSLGIPNNPCTMSTSLDMTCSPADHQLLMDTHILALSRDTTSSSSCFSTGLSSFNGLSANLSDGLPSLTSSSSGYAVGTGMPPSSMSFEGMSMLPEGDFQTLQSGGDYTRPMQSGGDYARPILDLMQMSPLDSQQQQHATQTGLHGLSIFNRQTMM